MHPSSTTSFGLSGREQTTGRKQSGQKVNIFEFHKYTWNHHVKFIPISTNMPGIGSLIREMDVNISEI